MVDANELVAGGGDVKIRLLFINEKRVRDPYVLNELRADGERFDAGTFLVSEPRVRPELSEVEVQCKVLWRNRLVKQ